MTSILRNNRTGPALLFTLQFTLCVSLLVFPGVLQAAYVYSDRAPDDTIPLTLESARKHLAILQNAPNSQSRSVQMAAANAYLHGAVIHGLPPTNPGGLKIPVRPALAAFSPRADTAFPPPFTSLENVVAFIQGQRYVFPDGSLGLPATFSVPSEFQGQVLNNFDSDRLLKNGTGLYDTALACLALTYHTDLKDCQQILDIYRARTYLQGYRLPGGTGIDLWAEPNFNGNNNGAAFKPMGIDPITRREAYYLFDFTPTYGAYSAVGKQPWNYFTPHTGPNAWLVIAIAKFVESARKSGFLSEEALKPYINFATGIGYGMLAMQNPDFKNPPEETRDHGDTQGCIRYAPLKSFHESNEPDHFDVCNAENNISAYAAFGALATIAADGQDRTDFALGRDRIAWWFQNATVYDPTTDRQQTGLMDPGTGMFNVGVTYSAERKRWEIQTDSRRQLLFATDSGGTWAISALGPQGITDITHDPASAYRMYMSVRKLTGRFAFEDPLNPGRIVTILPAGPTDRLDGFDFSNLFSADESLISPEWSAGAIFAAKQLLSYYGDGGDGFGQISAVQIQGLKNDIASMQAFIAKHPNAYALGPGLGGFRRGQTGFGWFSPPAGASAMAAIYAQFPEDPLAWVREPLGAP